MKPRRLILRVYLVTLAQFVAVGLLLFILQVTVFKPPPPPFRPGRPEDFIVRKAAADRHDPDALAADLKRADVDFGLHLTLYTRDGELIASNHAIVPGPLPAARVHELDEHPVLPGPRPHTVVVRVRENAIVVVYGIVDLVGVPTTPAILPILTLVAVLGCVLLGSVLFARTLARPLGRIAAVARDFGRGQLDARVGLKRPDELGEVADAFDDMAEQVTRLLRRQKELLANVSHELRTPLARIRVALDLAAEGDAELAREALADIAHDWGDLDRLVEDVLAAARFDLGSESSKTPLLRKEILDLGPELQRSVARFRQVHHGRELDVDVPPGLPAIEGDPVVLRRVFDNLLDNARKYSEPGSRIALRAHAGDGGVVVEVSDHGIGIDPDDLAHVFAPFYRTDRSRARATGGVGLGLTLAKRIVDAHHGRIDIDSAPGEGTTVRVVLPSAPL
jgi:signal transduction histidine kinase